MAAENPSLCEARHWFVLLCTEANGPHKIVGEYETEELPLAEYRRLLAKGWPTTRAASVYEADSRTQLVDHLAKRVRLRACGTPSDYWHSPEGQAQLERDRQFEEEILGI